MTKEAAKNETTEEVIDYNPSSEKPVRGMWMSIFATFVITWLVMIAGGIYLRVGKSFLGALGVGTIGSQLPGTRDYLKMLENYNPASIPPGWDPMENVGRSVSRELNGIFNPIIPSSNSTIPSGGSRSARQSGLDRLLEFEQSNPQYTPPPSQTNEIGNSGGYGPLNSERPSGGKAEF